MGIPVKIINPEKVIIVFLLRIIASNSMSICAAESICGDAQPPFFHFKNLSP